MVRMVAADLSAGALLLERLDADRPLRHLGMPDAIRVAGRLLRRLAVPAPPGFRDVRTLVTATTHSLQEQPARPDCPIPRDWLQTALALARFLSEHAGTDLLIHADLHYDNILVGTREPWLAIDPRPVAGEPEGAVPELLWTGLDDEEDDAEIRLRLATLVESAELNLERAHAWVIVRCVDYWLWGLEHGLTRDPERCRRILHALLGERSHLSA
jgi:streptomycin 6-kinase